MPLDRESRSSGRGQSSVPPGAGRARGGDPHARRIACLTSTAILILVSIESGRRAANSADASCPIFHRHRRRLLQCLPGLSNPRGLVSRALFTRCSLATSSQLLQPPPAAWRSLRQILAPRAVFFLRPSGNRRGRVGGNRLPRSCLGFDPDRLRAIESEPEIRVVRSGCGPSMPPPSRRRFLASSLVPRPCPPPAMPGAALPWSVPWHSSVRVRLKFRVPTVGFVCFECGHVAVSSRSRGCMCSPPLTSKRSHERVSDFFHKSSEVRFHRPRGMSWAALGNRAQIPSSFEPSGITPVGAVLGRWLRGIQPGSAWLAARRHMPRACLLDRLLYHRACATTWTRSMRARGNRWPCDPSLSK